MISSRDKQHAVLHLLRSGAARAEDVQRALVWLGELADGYEHPPTPARHREGCPCRDHARERWRAEVIAAWEQAGRPKMQHAA